MPVQIACLIGKEEVKIESCLHLCKCTLVSSMWGIGTAYVKGVFHVKRGWWRLQTSKANYLRQKILWSKRCLKYSPTKYQIESVDVAQTSIVLWGWTVCCPISTEMGQFAFSFDSLVRQPASCPFNGQFLNLNCITPTSRCFHTICFMIWKYIA